MVKDQITYKLLVCFLLPQFQIISHFKNLEESKHLKFESVSCTSLLDIHTFLAREFNSIELLKCIIKLSYELSYTSEIRMYMDY
jgi:hypothetical protein